MISEELKKVLELGIDCGLPTLGEAVYNVVIHHNLYPRDYNFKALVEEAESLGPADTLLKDIL